MDIYINTNLILYVCRQKGTDLFVGVDNQLNISQEVFCFVAGRTGAGGR
jgi:hypothetical protein